MAPFDPRTEALALQPKFSNEFQEMILGFSQEIIHHLAFAPSPHTNRAWLLNDSHTSTVSLCGLDFYFNYDNEVPSRPQTTAIWIRVLNQNGCNVWFRIQETVERKDKRVEIYSKELLNCLEWNQREDNYGIPEVINGLPNGVFLKDFFRHPNFERAESKLKTWAAVVDEMRQLLPCACTGNYTN
ncbi:MAG: hypothetical protein EAZ53_13300 [Bacteroidetes bacterium]|nr:MAG: hypothetical protein EAZ53_13300 [Bacteroidota bacterium]